jgi:hypothetical protein
VARQRVEVAGPEVVEVDVRSEEGCGDTGVCARHLRVDRAREHTDRCDDCEHRRERGQQTADPARVKAA